MVYNKSIEYITSINGICNMLLNKASETKDAKLYYISKMIHNYLVKYIKAQNVDLTQIEKIDYVNLVPLYSYVSDNDIHLYDLLTIKDNDIDVNNDSHIERFVLSHIFFMYTSIDSSNNTV